jgi:sugar phosphate isomerase/epimerase
MTSRRTFIKHTGLAAASILPLTRLMASPVKREPFGLQLWSVRTDMAHDPKATLKDIASFGYQQIESFEGEKGMFWGMSAKEFGRYTRDLGLTVIASHGDYKKDFEKKAADAASIGMKYLICPYKGPQKTAEDFKRIAEEFNKAGEVCRKHGIRFGYHNHDYSFKKIDNQVPEDILITNTDPALVDFELDIYWAVTAGADPVAYFKKYQNRFRLCHVKDRIKNAPATETEASCVLGKGSIPWATVLPAAKRYGVRYFIVEHERYDDGTPLTCAKDDAAFMKKLSF